jgi:hypothetical protein
MSCNDIIEHNPENLTKVRQIPLPLLLFCAIVFLWFFAYYQGWLGIRWGDLIASDGYMRLAGVVQLHDTGHWFKAFSPRSNAPYGETLHWTRPLDVLLWAGAWFLSPWLGFKSALLWWGVMISPVLHALTALILIWAARPFLQRAGLPSLVLLFLGQFHLGMWFQAGRPDHHSLILLLFTLTLGYTMRLLLQPYRPALCYAAGAFAALGLWVSVETLLPVFLSLAVLGLMWVRSREDFAPKIFSFSLAIFISLGVALAMERLPHFRRVEYDSLSILHLSLFGLITLAWFLIYAVDRRFAFSRRLANRLAIMAAAAVALTVAMGLTFPKFFAGPFADIDKQIVAIWLDKVVEYVPLIDPEGHLVPAAGLLLGQTLIALPCTLYLLWRNRRGHYQPWFYLGLSFLVFIPLSVRQPRWWAYAEILFVFPLAELIATLINAVAPYFTGFRKALVPALVSVTLCVGIFLLPIVLMLEMKHSDKEPLPIVVSLSQLLTFLDNNCDWANHPKRILTHIFSGPEILFRTPHEVIATPYHRNSSGIMCAFEVMTATEDDKARQLIKNRGIDAIILCLQTNEADIYSLPGAKSTFYQHLRQGLQAAWIRPVPLPPELADSFRVFEVLADLPG